MEEDMFEGKVAIVTGGTRGIGAGITRNLARNGIRVGAGYSRGKEAAEAIVIELAAENAAPVSIHQGQIDDPAACERVVAEVLERFGRVDFLINNAGITIDKTMRKMSPNDWQRVLNVNLFGSFCMIKAVLEHMIERGSGRIVNISSLTGSTGNVGQANYAASKAGLFGLTKSLAMEMARRGITVNAIAPGFIETDMVAAIPAAQLEKYVERIPVRRMGTPEDVAHLVKFLLEDESSYITGATYNVAGGLDLGW
jgi:NAD(P)-dependent dehydrogenase (short-subunit alcohol dehydrogenase family)